MHNQTTYIHFPNTASVCTLTHPLERESGNELRIVVVIRSSENTRCEFACAQNTKNHLVPSPRFRHIVSTRQMQRIQQSLLTGLMS